MHMSSKLAKPIFNPQKIADALRTTEYKSISYAAAEIIDNSYEAGADELLIMIESDLIDGRKRIKNIAFLDNGIGMTPDELQTAMSIGESTRIEKSGIGRFGVGLKYSSLFAAPRLEVYSWKNIDEVYYSYLDINELKTGEQTEIVFPVKKNLPSEYKKFFQNMKSNSGTLIFWKNVDKSDVKTAAGLMKRFDADFGSIFRYFIDNDRLKIGLINYDVSLGIKYIKARDPLFLMTKDFFLADSTKFGEKGTEPNAEPIFEPYVPQGYSTNQITIPVKFLNENKSEVESDLIIKFSIVKEKFYNLKSHRFNNPGDSPIGKYIKAYTGISVVRSEREIDFGKFDFFDEINNPQHRWWGIELSFGSMLDEVFAVSNNKQSIVLKKPSRTEKIENQSDGEEHIWEKINNVIEPVLKEMLKRNRLIQQGSRSQKNTPSIVNTGGNSKNIISDKPDNHSFTDEAKYTRSEEKIPEKESYIDEKFKKALGKTSETDSDVYIDAMLKSEKELMEIYPRIEFKDISKGFVFDRVDGKGKIYVGNYLKQYSIENETVLMYLNEMAEYYDQKNSLQYAKFIRGYMEYLSKSILESEKSK